MSRLDAPPALVRPAWVSVDQMVFFNGRPLLSGVGRAFDPVAVAMVTWLAMHAEARIVLSTSWAASGNKSAMVGVLRASDLDPDLLHDDWMTPRLNPAAKSIHPRGYETRADEILAWLAKHPEVSHWVAFDDDPVPPPGGIVVPFEDGIGQRHFEQAQKLLGIGSATA